jgi:hypothetical protein
VFKLQSVGIPSFVEVFLSATISVVQEAVSALLDVYCALLKCRLTAELARHSRTSLGMLIILCKRLQPIYAKPPTRITRVYVYAREKNSNTAKCKA